MRDILKLEEAAMFGVSVLVLVLFGLPWWIFLLLLLGPDISMLGYLAGNRVGAICYNLFHHKGIAIILIIAGIQLGSYQSDILSISGVVLFGHASMDRMFGYGLKYFQGFKFTHLGNLGKIKV